MRMSDWSSDVCSSDLYNHGSSARVAHGDAPIRLSTADIMLRLQPTLEGFGIRDNLLEDVAGIYERHVWEDGVMPSDAATRAAQKALAASGVAHERSEERRVGKECVSYV